MAEALSGELFYRAYKPKSSFFVLLDSLIVDCYVKLYKLINKELLNILPLGMISDPNSTRRRSSPHHHQLVLSAPLSCF